MLTFEEQTLITDKLDEQISTLGNPREAIAAAFFGQSLASDLASNPPRLLAIDAVRLCMMDKWNNTPSFLETLITTFQLHVIYPGIGEILQRIRVRPPVVNIFNTSVFANDNVFVNRKGFRTQIEQFSKPANNNSPIIVITGTEKSGKSYSSTFINHFANQSGAAFVYRFEFETAFGLETSPLMIARDLISSMGRNPGNPPPLETNLKLYSDQLANWVLNEACQVNGQHWFILDNFNNDKVRQDTRDFLLGLTRKVNGGIVQQRCRIILLGFDSGALTVDANRWMEHGVEKCTKADIENSVREIIAIAASALDPSVLNPMVLDDLPAAERKMPELNYRLRAMLKTIRAVNEMFVQKPGLDYLAIMMGILKDLPAGEEKMKQLNIRITAMWDTLNDNS